MKSWYFYESTRKWELFIFSILFYFILSVWWKSENGSKGREGVREGGREVFPMLGKICALGRKAAKQVRVVVLYSKDFGSGLPFYSQKAVWEPCTDRKGNHVKQNQKKKYMSVKQNKAHILCTKPATLVAEWEQVEVEGEKKKKVKDHFVRTFLYCNKHYTAWHPNSLVH